MTIEKFVEVLEFIDSCNIMLVDKNEPVRTANKGELLLVNKIDKAYLCGRYADKIEREQDETNEE